MLWRKLAIFDENDTTQLSVIAEMGKNERAAGVNCNSKKLISIDDHLCLENEKWHAPTLIVTDQEHKNSKESYVEEDETENLFIYLLFY